MQNSFSASITTTGQQIWCIVEGDTIFQTDLTGARLAIGKTNAAYSDIETVTQQYYDKLVELGAIIPPKTAEQLVQDQQKVVLDLAQIVQSLQAEIKEMKANEHKCSCANGKPNVSKCEDKPSVPASTTTDGGNGKQPVQRVGKSS